MYICITQSRDKAEKRGISVPSLRSPTKVLPKPIIWGRGSEELPYSAKPPHRILCLDIDNHPVTPSYSEVFLLLNFITIIEWEQISRQSFHSSSFLK